MAILVSNLRIGLDDGDSKAFALAQEKLKINSSDISDIRIYKRSLDARRKFAFSFVVSVLVKLKINESEVVKATSDNFVVLKEEFNFTPAIGSKKASSPPIIIGFGPAGLFAALALAKQGYNPIVFERGEDIDSRAKRVEQFWKEGVLSENTNVQFGEGGAGTFSDGKLTTRISDSHCEYVLKEFVNHGADNEILYTAKPHIGTDKLREIIKNIRNDIIANGGRVYFEKALTDIEISDGKVKSITVENEKIGVEALILAVGHSARDVFYMLNKKGIALANKSFSVGVRIEHLQKDINKMLYGEMQGNKNLPVGEYQLSKRVGNDAVYTFCMCPGGVVVPAASEMGGIVTNGMSEHARNGVNANSALVVSVSEQDYGDKLFAGVEYQQALERSAFNLSSSYKAPAQTVDCFMAGKVGLNIKNTLPSYALGVIPADFNKLFSSRVVSFLKLGINDFNKRSVGFGTPNSVLTGVETRTSSPIRILRDRETLQSISSAGLYPCGEGAGYAGGIISAAVDGVKIAEKIMEIYAPK